MRTDLITENIQDLRELWVNNISTSHHIRILKIFIPFIFTSKLGLINYGRKRQCFVIPLSGMWHDAIPFSIPQFNEIPHHTSFVLTNLTWSYVIKQQSFTYKILNWSVKWFTRELPGNCLRLMLKLYVFINLSRRD